MKTLNERTEIATAINFKKMPVIKFDLAKKDEYGYSGTKVCIDNGTYRDGNPYYIHATLRSYNDSNCFEFTQHGCCLSNRFDYREIDEMLEYANAPIIKKDQDILIVPINSETQVAYAPVVLHTGDHTNPHCQEPLPLEKFFLCYEAR